MATSLRGPARAAPALPLGLAACAKDVPPPGAPTPAGPRTYLNAAALTTVWLPPAYEGWNSSRSLASLSQGYGVHDRCDLGEFNQKGSMTTHHGNRGQWQRCPWPLPGQDPQMREDRGRHHLNGAAAPETITITDGSTWSASTRRPGPGQVFPVAYIPVL